MTYTFIGHLYLIVSASMLPIYSFYWYLFYGNEIIELGLLSSFRMECDELRGESEVEPDSDHEDEDGGGCGLGSGGGWLGHPLYNFHAVSHVTSSHNTFNDVHTKSNLSPSDDRSGENCS